MNDNYKIPQPEDGASELREPAVAYCPAGRRAAEPWMTSIADDEDHLDEFGEEPITAPDGGHWFDWAMKNSPAFREHFDRCMEESELDIKEGRVYTSEELDEKLEWRIKNNQWDDIRERMRRRNEI